MGVCHGVMGDLDTALSFFESAVACDPHEVMGWYNMALVYKLKGDKKKALDFFLKADAAKQDSFEIAFQTGKIYFETGDAETGTKYYRRVLALAEHTRGNHRFVGDCHVALGEPEKALKAYEAAVKENPSDAHALSALGALYDTKGENPEIAMVLCQQSVDIAPQNSLFRRRLAKLHLKQGRVDEALAHFKAAENMDAAHGPGENQEREKSPCGCEKDPGLPSVASAEG
jgi:tetratricopeptide (TPR) repeat protein